MRWQAPPAGALLIEPLDEVTAVYHRPSGTTHLLASPAPEILEALSGDALTPAELLARLRDRFDLPDGTEAALAARLDELAAAGLLSRA
jgi:PqqD family protein of HPr-rel-A system